MTAAVVTAAEVTLVLEVAGQTIMEETLLETAVLVTTKKAVK